MFLLAAQPCFPRGLSMGILFQTGQNMIHGYVDSAFEAVRDEFARNFAERGEVGASVCVVHQGRVVVDLWGGYAQRHEQRPWQRDTLGVIFSCTKAAVALAALRLVSQGRLDLDAPVTQYWPEFAAQGKEAIPVRWLLSHQSGLPAFREPLPVGALYHWETITNALAQMAPWYEPGTRQAYGAGTFGHLVGEVVRRVDGRPLGQYFHQEIAEPLGLDFYLGLPESEHARVAATIKPDPLPPGVPPWRFLSHANAHPESIQASVLRNTGRRLGDTDSPQALSACLPSSGAVANGRSLAGLYAAVLSGRVIDRRTLSEAMDTHSATAIDGTLLVGMAFGLGFMKRADNRRGPAGAQDSLLIGRRAFGHAGMGGSLGFADPTCELAFGYTMNKQGHGVLLNPRGQALVDAVYACVGTASD
ncbi:MAG: serine hydrolase domain-containing protein [Gemmataceae bacterium]